MGTLVNVRPVNREAGNGLSNHLAQDAQCEVAGMTVLV